MVRIISALILAVTASCVSAQEPLKLVDNPPDRYTVTKGDTLWGISGQFLKEPWRWPEIWRMNKDQIKNPHLIYPGDTVYLDTSDGSPRLRLGKPISGTSKEQRISPQVYSEPSETSIPSIPANVIEPYLSQPLIIEAGSDETAARIVATQEERMMMGLADSFYAAGIPENAQGKWQIYRPGKPLKDPKTGEVLAYEAFFVGNAQLTRPGTPASMTITVAKEEVARGDRLIPAPPAKVVNYAPRRPATPLQGHIVSIYGGLTEGGLNSVISVNRGSRDGVEVGHVLALYRNRVSLNVDDNGVKTETPVPDERYGLAFVFRTFDRISYALIVRASKPVIMGDNFGNP